LGYRDRTFLSKGVVSASALLTEGREVGLEANISNQSKIVMTNAYNFAPQKSLQISAVPKGRPVSLQQCDRLYDNDYSLIIDIYFYETFSTLTQTSAACAQLFRHPV
jgi:hypothetical protein